MDCIQSIGYMKLSKGTSIFNDQELNAAIEKHGKLKTFKKGAIILRPGEEILFIPIVLKGSIRIIREDAEGSEVFLYHLYPGQTCAMSLTCCQAGKKSMIKAIAEDDTELVQLPVEVTENWFDFKEWKTYISSNYSARFTELLEVIDLIAFNHMDSQLLNYLQERSKAINSRFLEITHQEIANELHAHRESISRLLRTMEKKKLLKLGRNNIELLDAVG